MLEGLEAGKPEGEEALSRGNEKFRQDQNLSNKKEQNNGRRKMAEIRSLEARR